MPITVIYSNEYTFLKIFKISVLLRTVGLLENFSLSKAYSSCSLFLGSVRLFEPSLAVFEYSRNPIFYLQMLLRKVWLEEKWETMILMYLASGGVQVMAQRGYWKETEYSLLQSFTTTFVSILQWLTRKLEQKRMT